jgi:pimeloyl-ACP methyl ester carboxylesterase
MEKTIVILSGWRVPGSRYQIVQHLLEKEGFTVYAPNLPGFGEQTLIKPVMTVDDYVDFVVSYMKKNNIKKAIFIAHSFGGRVVAKLIRFYPQYVDSVILTGTPLIKQSLSLKKKILVMLARLIKKGLVFSFGQKRMRKILYYFLNEWDYYKVDSHLKETFKEVIKEDISPCLPYITIPTLVLWGENDTLVSTKIGREIARRIPNAIYEEIKNGSHKLPYESPEIFVEKILRFIKRK